MGRGLLFTVKGADFSAVSVGSVLFKPVTAGLLSLHELRESSAVCIRNNAGGASGAIFGVPTIFPGVVRSDETNGVQFATKPNGTHTFAAIIKIRTGAITTSYPVGSFTATATVDGSSVLKMDTNNITASVGSFTAGGVFVASINAALPKPATNTYELYIVKIVNNSGVTIIHPKTGASASGGTVNNFNFANPDYYCAGARNLANELDYVAMFAHWNKVTTSAEDETLYTEAKRYFASLGVDI